MPSQPVKAFLFGKLPGHGDFVSRGLTAHERQSWDDLCSAALQSARRELGEGFEAAHDASPPWRFAGQQGVGALAPSVDSAGRRFFLVLGAKNFGDSDEVAAAMEALIYRALTERLDADTLLASAATAAKATAPAGGPTREAERWWVEGQPRRGPPERLILASPETQR
ncbi:MAG TPA: type VI secretion system-associated protein TagF [Caulobacteraceae bacterium]